MLLINTEAKLAFNLHNRGLEIERKHGRSIINMEEIREAALAFYLNLPDDQKKLASEKFKEIDSDGSGTINMEEFKKSMGSSFDYNSKIMERCFKELDKNGDNELDFEKYITLYYLVDSGWVQLHCAGSGCRAAPFIKGLYFTCVHCFHHNKEKTFDLCTSCYLKKLYSHNHTNFADNHILLLSKAACNGFTSEPSDSESDSESDSMSYQVAQSRSKRRALVGFFNSAKANVGLGDVSEESCSIM